LSEQDAKIKEEVGLKMAGTEHGKKIGTKSTKDQTRPKVN